MDKDLSLKVFKMILMTQDIEASVFVNCVWELLTKKTPKTNLLVLRGQPNTGKSMLARSIADMFTHISTIQGIQVSFPYQNLINVEIGLIEEPNFTIETLQTFKKLAEGTDTEVCVKLKQDEVFHRTPLIITSNNKFDQNAPPAERMAFIMRYNEFLLCIAAPFLKHIKKKINPFFWNIMFYEHCFNGLAYDSTSSSDDDLVETDFELCLLIEAGSLVQNQKTTKESKPETLKNTSIQTATKQK